MIVYVAVVTKTPYVFTGSLRQAGDWSCFVDRDKTAVITRAIKARDSWEREGRGPYDVFLGVLTHKINQPVQYSLTPFGEGMKLKKVQRKKRG